MVTYVLSANNVLFCPYTCRPLLPVYTILTNRLVCVHDQRFLQCYDVLRGYRVTVT